MSVGHFQSNLKLLRNLGAYETELIIIQIKTSVFQLKAVTLRMPMNFYLANVYYLPS